MNSSAPFLGKKRVYGDVQKALEALENAYRKAGYGTVQVFVPEQELGAGVVRLVVTESVIGKITLTGNKHFDAANIRNTLPGLQEGKAPNMRQLSENIQLANENPAKQIEVTLGVSEEEGKVNAKVNVTDERSESRHRHRRQHRHRRPRAATASASPTRTPTCSTATRF